MGNPSESPCRPLVDSRVQGKERWYGERAGWLLRAWEAIRLCATILIQGCKV
jgi:hypothetical protein